MTSELTRRDRRPGPSVRTRVVEYAGEARLEHEDRLATEEPLEIRLAWPGAPARRVAVTMRTPGHDFELAVGWLVHERVIEPARIAAVRYCTDTDLSPLEQFNVVTVEVTSPPLRVPGARDVSSACGVCGKESIADAVGGPLPRVSDFQVPLDVVRGLPDRLREEQAGFARTGGLHAAGLFEVDGTRVVVREDVGRHNAVDKAVGAVLLEPRAVPGVLVLSGRVGFELVQKAVVSGIGLVVAVGAPSSLAVALAQESGVGVVGFTRPDRCVVYAGDQRLGV
ncbi:MAG: formate dehydrogenase accessory sulfurtransferase FdhD [Propionibacteriales bacterium]|nr:formate dehydrogenase accessory sulfurtransferase FdhD [Propionibacteriales bacterium]